MSIRNMLAQLIPKGGGPPITLHQAINVVGRSSKLCDIVVDHTSVSKQHCMLVKTDGLIYLRDLASTNGTRVNGQRVIRGALLPGDLLTLSGVSFRIHLGPDEPMAVGKVSQIQPTQMIPSQDDSGMNGDDTFRSPAPNEGSKSDVRFLRDSDLLMPD